MSGSDRFMHFNFHGDMASHEKPKDNIWEKAADKLGNTLSDAIEGSRLEAPLLEKGEEPEGHKWYRVHIPEGISGDGSEYHIYIKRGIDSGKGPLCVFFSGGGLAWDEKTAENPTTGGRLVVGDDAFYRNNLKPITQLVNIGMGITDLNHRKNPFYDWNFVIITYPTGDFHVGQNDYEYRAEDGSIQTLHFHGYKNFTESMRISIELFPQPDKLLIAGDSAGGFAVPALAGTILEEYYDRCVNITVLSDASLLEMDDCANIVTNIWKAPERIAGPVRSNNLTLDWYRELVNTYGDRIKYLYAGSRLDHRLSAYMNQIENDIYKTGHEIQQEYSIVFDKMIGNLKELTSKFGIYEYDFKNIIHGGGGTVHTIVRTPLFFAARHGEASVAEWLEAATYGDIYDVMPK